MGSEVMNFPKPEDIRGGWGTASNPELGIIESAHLEIEDHGLFTIRLDINFGGTGQGFGSHCLDAYDKVKKRRVGTAFGCEAILQLLRAVGVQSWEELKGKEIWCYRGVEGTIMQIEAPKYRKHEGYLNMQELAEEYIGKKGEDRWAE